MNPEPSPAERARALRAQRRRRIALIRKRVTALSVAGFIALFSTIYVQMAAGHDPALSTKTKSSKADTTTTTKAATSTDSESESSVAPSSVAPAPVTTAQS